MVHPHPLRVGLRIDDHVAFRILAVVFASMMRALGSSFRADGVSGRDSYHAIRVNDQYRFVFRFEGHDAYDVRCADYL